MAIVGAENGISLYNLLLNDSVEVQAESLLCDANEFLR